MEEIEIFLQKAKELMDKTINHANQEFAKIRAGKAMPNMLDGIQVEYYGTLVPLNQVASINTPDARTLMIKPFEKSILIEIEKAIINSKLELNPQNDGEFVRINIPVLTEERRINLLKKVKAEAELSKINIRNIRQDTNNSLKQLQKEGASKDIVKDAEDEVQKITNIYIAKIDELIAAKEVDVMTI